MYLNRHWKFLLGLTLTLSLLWPMLAAPYFSHHDDVQVIRLHQMNKCLKDNQYPCRWVPDLGGLYGYPIFNYYAPLSYYYGEVFYALSGDFLVAAKAMFATALIGSFLFMFLLCNDIWGNKNSALLGSVFYVFAPYHAVLLYVRGAMGELWALMFFPLILWTLLKLFQTRSVLYSLQLAVAISLLILSHNLSAMVFLPIVCVYALCLLKYEWNLKTLKLLILSGTLSLLLSSFYLIPALVEKKLVSVETTTYGYFSYTEHFKGLRKLILDHSWGWGASVREIPGGERDGMSFQIGWLHLIALAIAIFGLRKIKVVDKRFYLIIFSIATIVVALFLIHPKSIYVWKLIPPLKYLQFPWRLLGIIIFFISLCAGSIFVWIGKSRQVMLLLVLVVLVVVFNFSYFRPEKFYYLNQDQILSGQNWDKQIKRSIFDYLPKSAKAPPAELAQSRYEIIYGNADIKNLKEGSDWMSLDINSTTLTILRLSIYYFPDWQVKIDHKKIGINPKNDLGLITFSVDPGEHHIDARLYDTPIRSASNLLSVFGFLSLLFLSLSQFPYTRRWLNYYLERFKG